MNRPKWMMTTAFVGGALLLAACGGGGEAPTPQPEPQPQPTPTEQAGTVLGTITPFAPGKASVVKPEELATPSTVDSSGKFGFTLPNAETMTTTYGGDLFPVHDAEQGVGVFGLCSNVKTDAPGSLRLYPLNKLTTDTGLQLFANTNPQNTETLPLTFKVWWFANQDTTFTFSGECTLWNKVNTTLTLKRGWNVLDVALYSDHTTVAAGAQPGAAQAWTPFNAGGLGSLNLRPNLLEPWKVVPDFRR
ncbi:MAG: hypothetical protein Q4C89_05535 [Deinococcus sp.]|uniref:hypothetical protein n=1 Tax=Deinococcus sp. TaxID=47478 RepID=UPI0026DC9017|nr:hypothetical protein [Deinococcus sp.]MDO4245463.1 hypothetical protein [Deinococcus sp.]